MEETYVTSKNRRFFEDRVLAEHYEYAERVFYGMLNLMPPFVRKFFYRVLFCEFGRKNKIGENCIFRYPWKIKLGNLIEIGYGARIYPSLKVKDAYIEIRDGATIAPGLTIFGAGHPRGEKRSSHVASSVLIEEDAYIGGNVTIRYGVTIGRGAVIATGSVVVSDVAPNTTVGGVPARSITN